MFVFQKGMHSSWELYQALKFMSEKSQSKWVFRIKLFTNVLASFTFLSICNQGHTAQLMPAKEKQTHK